jgi:hypothetical protein
MTALARSFPTLADAPLDPFDAEALDEWAASHVSHGGLHAARFVLAVWSGHAGRQTGRTRETDDGESPWRIELETWWLCGPFDAVDAMGTWDATHRAAFVAWATAPWWP